jgi:hypothetical protein
VKYLAAFLALAAALALGALFLLQDNSADTLPSGASASAGVDKLGWRKPELVSPDKVRPPAAPAIIDDMPPAAAPADSADGSSQAAQSALPQGELPVPVSLPEKLTAESVSSALCAVTNSVSESRLPSLRAPLDAAGLVGSMQIVRAYAESRYAVYAGPFNAKKAGEVAAALKAKGFDGAAVKATKKGGRAVVLGVFRSSADADAWARGSAARTDGVELHVTGLEPPDPGAVRLVFAPLQKESAEALWRLALRERLTLYACPAER